MRSLLSYLSVLLVVTAMLPACVSAQHHPQVAIVTNFGEIVVELLPDDAPITVDNFLKYVNTGFYDGLVFHRVIENFMIQAGGYYVVGAVIYYLEPGNPIINESYNSLSNVRGTIAMARRIDPNSATSQFHVNQTDNLFLDRDNAADGFGYCVFGRVISGMDVVDAIAQTPTYYVHSSLANFPHSPTVDILRAHVRPCDRVDCSDLTFDGAVDFEDLVVLASHWLGDNCSPANAFCDGTDLDYSGHLDLADFAFFSENWRRQN